MTRWITATMKLFEPQITALLLERDDTIKAWQKRHPKRNVYEDRELDIASELRISLKDQVNRVNAALQSAKGSGGAPRGLPTKDDTAARPK